jgi:hypothetical protein
MSLSLTFQAFGEAMRLTNKAIQDPDENESVETLRAVLILNMAEVSTY